VVLEIYKEVFILESRPRTCVVQFILHVSTPLQLYNSSTTQMSDDIFDSALNLEDNAYNEGYELGFTDGSRSGRIEGRAFGLQKGFEKFVELGRLHGRACVWGARLTDPTSRAQTSSYDGSKEQTPDDNEAVAISSTPSNPQASPSIPAILHNTRLDKHIRTLFALTDPAGLTTQNTEEAVAEFDDRMKRAAAKAKVVEQIVGERTSATVVGGMSNPRSPERRSGVKVTGERAVESNMEDFSIGSARK
jgi:hypothetical protein